MIMEISWVTGIGWIIFCLFLIGFIWRRDEMHYEEQQEEEYLDGLKREREEKPKNDKDRPE